MQMKEKQTLRMFKLNLPQRLRSVQQYFNIFYTLNLAATESSANASYFRRWEVFTLLKIIKCVFMRGCRFIRKLS